METLLRLALIAGTSASMGGLQRAGRRVAICAAVALTVGAIVAGAIGCFAAAAWYALLPQLGEVRSAVIIGLILALVAGLICGIAEARRRRMMRRAGPDLGLLAALPSRLPNIDIGRTLERHAGTILLGAFAAGIFLNRRR
jgi:ABC-type proline/glycine betaine transport system permease subunit